MKNIAKCRKCGDVIESKHRHDFVTCKCGAISVDGGHDYHRRCGNPDDFINEQEIEFEDFVKKQIDTAIENKKYVPVAVKVLMAKYLELAKTLEAWRNDAKMLEDNYDHVKQKLESIQQIIKPLKRKHILD